MIRGNVLFEVEKIEQLALINRLTTHHDLRPSLKGSDDGIMIRQYPRGLFQQHRSNSTELTEATSPSMSAVPPIPTVSSRRRFFRGRQSRRSTWFAGPCPLQCRQPVERGGRQWAFLDRGECI